MIRDDATRGDAPHRNLLERIESRQLQTGRVCYRERRFDRLRLRTRFRAPDTRYGESIRASGDTIICRTAIRPAERDQDRRNERPLEDHAARQHL